ncbi:hypothetical protein [Nonomuraea endophytica]|uniref:hypothetical protein n=1 Tax=Nonomuraea endophytica TaxID=714136 RepID=UPI0037C65492
MAVIILVLILAGITTGVIYRKPGAREAARGAWQQGRQQARAEAGHGWQAARSGYIRAQDHLGRPVRGRDGKLYRPGPRNWQWWAGHGLRLSAGTAALAAGTIWAGGHLLAGAGRIGKAAIQGGRQAHQRHRDTIEVDAVEVADPDKSADGKPADRGAGDGPEPPRPAAGDGPGGQTSAPRPSPGHTEDGGPCPCETCTGRAQAAAAAAWKSAAAEPAATSVPRQGRPVVDLTGFDSPTRPASAPQPVRAGAGGPPVRRFYPPASWDGEQSRPQVRADELQVGDRTHNGGVVTRIEPWGSGYGVTVHQRDLKTGKDHKVDYKPDSLLPIQPAPPAASAGQSRPTSPAQDRDTRAHQLKPGDRLVGADGQAGEVLALDDIDAASKALTVREADGRVHTRLLSGPALEERVTIRQPAPERPSAGAGLRRVPMAELKAGDQIYTSDGELATITAPLGQDGVLRWRDPAGAEHSQQIGPSQQQMPVQLRVPGQDNEPARQARLRLRDNDDLRAAGHLRPGDHVVNNDGHPVEVLQVTHDQGQLLLATRQPDGTRHLQVMAAEESVIVRAPGRAGIHDPNPDPVPAAPALDGTGGDGGSSPEAATPAAPTSNTAPEGSLLMMQAEATTLAAIKNVLKSEITSMDQRIAALDSLMASLNGQHVDGDTINGLSTYQDTITGARNQVTGLLQHVEARHNNVADAIAAAGGVNNVADKSFYAEA